MVHGLWRAACFLAGCLTTALLVRLVALWLVN
jgi:hypothetical protein